MTILPFNKAKILVLGDLMLDKYIIGKVSRISPEAPVPIVNVIEEKHTLGGAGNVINNLCGLGTQPTIIARIGKDSDGDIIKSYLSKNKVNHHLIESNLPTITKTRVVSGTQQMLRIDYEKVINLTENEEIRVLNQIKDLISQFDIVVVSDYGKGFISDNLIKNIVLICNQNNIKTIIDPKDRDWSKYANCSMITPNLKEFYDVLDEEPRNEDKVLEKLGKQVREHFNIRNLLITRSEKGMTLISEDKCIHLPTVAREVFDVSGAGDTVVATLAATMATGHPIEEAIQIANRAAGIVIGKFGTAAIKWEELVTD
jgi:rfaE bifunctional protein kinase chain/domain